MINNNLTDEQIRVRIEALKNVAGDSLCSTYTADAGLLEELLASRAELQQYRKAAGKAVMFIDGNISPDDAEKLLTATREFNGKPSEQATLVADPLPALVMPAKASAHDARMAVGFNRYAQRGYIEGWNACRAAMLEVKAQNAE